MSIISIAIAEIYEQTGDLVNLETNLMPPTGSFRAALRSDNMPLFDPHDGEQELAGYASTPELALTKLEEVLERYFAREMPPEVTVASDVNRFDVRWEDDNGFWRAKAFKGDEPRGEGLGGSAMGAIETWAMLDEEEREDLEHYAQERDNQEP